MTHRSVVGVHLLLFDGKEVLLGLREAQGRWQPPAGCLEEGETVREAMVREARAKLSITIAPYHLDLVHVVHHLEADEGRSGLHLFFRPRSYEGAVRVREPDGCDRLSYWPLGRLPTPLAEYAAVALAAYGRGEMLSEMGWPK